MTDRRTHGLDETLNRPDWVYFGR